MVNDPLEQSKEDYAEVINKIGSETSQVGIDAQYTHAIIIEYLKQINDRLERIEDQLKNK